MVAVPTHVAPGEHVPTADQRVVLHNVPWAHYEAHLELRGEKGTPRLTYLDGELEIMSPSRDHERVKSYLGRLVEAYAFERGIDLSPYGQWTLRAGPKQSGLEPDECYILGDQDRDVPDLAIEVIWTSGGMDKLEAYRRLQVPEVWFWKDDVITVHALRDDAYETRARSVCLPGLDFDVMLPLLDKPTAMQAVRTFRALLTKP